MRVQFLAGDDMIWGGNDGRIARWSSAAGGSTVAAFAQPIASLALSPRDHAVAVALADGALSLVTLDGAIRSLPPPSAGRARVLAISRDGRWLAAGTSDGVVAIYDTRSGRASTALRTSGAIRNIAMSPGGDMIAVATTAGEVHLARPAAGAAGPEWDAARMTWTSFAAQPRDLAFTPTGDLLMISCGDGVVWFYAPASNRWLYHPTGVASITAIRPADDGRTAATGDSAGRLMTFDLAAVREALAGRAAP